MKVNSIDIDEVINKAKECAALNRLVFELTNGINARDAENEELRNELHHFVEGHLNIANQRQHDRQELDLAQRGRQATNDLVKELQEKTIEIIRNIEQAKNQMRNNALKIGVITGSVSGGVSGGCGGALVGGFPGTIIGASVGTVSGGIVGGFVFPSALDVFLDSCLITPNVEKVKKWGRDV